MPKNGKPNYPSIRPVSRVLPSPQESQIDRSSEVAVDLRSAVPLLLDLINLDPEVIALICAGDPVVLRINRHPIDVLTILGLSIGLVNHGDEPAVHAWQSRRGVVIEASCLPLRCLVEVN